MAKSESLLDLLQIVDSSFPSGSYAHSSGLEALYVRQNVDLDAHVQFVLANGLARLELPMVREAFDARDARELQMLDGLMDVLLPVREFRQASRSIGRSVSRAVRHIQPGILADAGVEHHAVVFGAVLSAWHLDLSDGQAAYAWQALRQQLSAAQRLGKIGQSALQDLLHRLKPGVYAAIDVSRGVSRDEIGGFSPWLDLAGMAHAHQISRLFLS